VHHERPRLQAPRARRRLPIIGAGLYVEGNVGAATATGVGEEVIRVCGSYAAVD
jgi:isoaspartyl peptidase/L-asparaginase-like protein (Ntn-hydrolase superfamily)